MGISASLIMAKQRLFNNQQLHTWCRPFDISSI
jgi:hypothetical protein